MSLRALLATLSNQDPRAYVGISRDWRSMLRMHFLHASLETGLLRALDEPRSAEDLSRRMCVRRPELLEALLELGAGLGELERRGDRFRLRGRRARALADPRNDALAAMVQANVTYYNDAYRGLATRLEGAPLGEEPSGFGPLVARLSRITEPYMASYLNRLLRRREAVRALDVGCGTAAHLRTVLEAHPGSTGVGVEMDDAVARQASENLEAWGLGERAQIFMGGGTDLPEEVAGSFDVILLLSVVYYLPAPPRIALFRSLRERLAEGGTLVVATSCRGRGVDLFSANLNVATSSMRGLTPLPTRSEIEAQLQEAGFQRMRWKRLLPRTTYYGITAA